MSNHIYTFLRQTVENFHTTGAIAPSSHILANAITSRIERKRESIKVLEAGPGTGVFTKKIVTILDNNDGLDICEINPDFMRFIQTKFQTEKPFNEFKGKISFLPIDIQTLEGENKYDFIVSGLPLNAFTPEMVRKILNVYWRLLKPSGWLSYFEYIGIRNLKKAVSPKEERKRISEVSKIVKEFIEQNEVFHKSILWNLPPAYVRHCQKKGI